MTNSKVVKTVLFLCSGNYYRSRFAESLFNHWATAAGLPWRAESRGMRLNAGNEGPIALSVLSALADRGIVVTQPIRMPIAVADQDFERADRVIAMKRDEHERMMRERFPQRLDEVEFWDVHDVDCAAPDEALPYLEQRLRSLFDQMKAAS